MRHLAVIYVILFVAAAAGEVVVLWNGRLFVALMQRSNVETLTLAFFIVFFAYVGFLAARGLPGALRIAWFAILARMRGRDVVERHKAAALGRARAPDRVVALNVVLELEGRPHEAFELPVEDTAGNIGMLRIDGARLTHAGARREGSNNLLAYFARQVSQVAGPRIHREVDVVEWRSLDDEETDKYLGAVDFARNLARHLGAAEMWPRVALTVGEREELERRLSAICPALRSEAFLPQWEYAAEHKVPIIPEPLGLVSLGRSERRADPLATMGAATWVVAVAVALAVAFVLFPPWVPGV